MITRAISAFLTPLIRRIDAGRRRPWDAQQQFLNVLLSAGKDTLFGHEHHFDTIRHVDDFQRQVPVTEYDGLAPYVERIRQGEKHVLWNTPVHWFAKSSGTTAGKSKFIPVTRETLTRCHYRAARDVVALYLHQYPQSKLLSGRSLTLGGSLCADNGNHAILTGDLSAILIQNSPWYSEWKRAPKCDTALLADFETKITRIAAETHKKNITSFAGVPSWNMVLMKKVLEVTGKNNLLEVWPNLELFMHGGIFFEPYRLQYQELIPSNSMHYMETYNASEGFFAIQDDPTDAAMLLLPHVDVFYEFIPLHNLQKAREGKVIPDTMETVRTGVNYAMVITTSSGLWRYLIGDTVQFTSLTPHKIKITGRTRHFINAFGEELIIDNAENALQNACAQTGAAVTDYTVAPIFMDNSAKGAHEWVVEFVTPPADLNHFADLLDAALCAENSDYEAKRNKNTTLNRLHLHAAPSGTFYQWMDSHNKLGGQHKVPRLSNNRDIMEELLIQLRITK
jgi:hypothetical protein